MLYQQSWKNHISCRHVEGFVHCFSQGLLIQQDDKEPSTIPALKKVKYKELSKSIIFGWDVHRYMFYNSMGFCIF
jgi:hypothetical protein